ncbi:VWA domain-containing protein [Variovorax sp. Sphag1AA]|uniref:VWA domain-containing protein n=1 Tax=Variovorax sp. Sphag1AA TaxID=2587027 RepID=UPI001608DDFC|nr:VWA domain-containing protein [Variovorax sp. Sphag1AA]MBB3179248.1 Ca-activated chloride channel family protein [Variovorax sp. Sphag1AA]
MDALAQFHFLRPVWLWVLVPTAALWWLMGWRGDVRRRWQGTIAPHLLDALVVRRQAGQVIRPVHLTVAILAIGALAMAGPTWEQERPPFLEDKAPLAVAIDLGREMDAIDVSPTRLERAKLKLKALLARRDGARTAIYAYAGSTHLVLPLTEDAKLLQTFVDALETRIMPVKGKNTVLALKTIDADLAKEETPGTILFLTDGVEPAAFAAFKAQVDSGRALPVVLGIGTAQGGPLREGDGFVEEGGQRVFARLDVAALKRLQSDADVPVATVTLDGDDDVRWVQRHVQAHLAQKQAETHARWKDQGWWLCIPLAVLGALWFRKGWTIRWAAAVLVALVMSAPPHDALAADAEPAPTDTSKHFIDWWLTRDQQGRLAFQQGRYADAAARFEDPMWRGIALYRAGRYGEAVQSFALVDSAESDFNQGNALALQGRFAPAVTRYQEALKRRPDWAEAKANLEKVRKMIPPNEDEQQQDEELKPNKGDQIKEDKKDKGGEMQVMMASEQSTETWMRAIQTSPTELLARKFALQRERPPSPPSTGKGP